MNEPCAPHSCEVLRATTPAQVEIVRTLLQEYAADTGLDLCFQNFAAELERLPGDYGPPRGCLLLARHEAEWAGCVALRPLDANLNAIAETTHSCEMKRLFVRARFRGHGLGRALALAIMQEARGLGYKQMKLDTLESLAASNVLYRSLGFEPIAPYCRNPFPDARFFGLSLD